MKVVNFNNLRELSKAAAELIKIEISKNPKLVLALPTGKTPLFLYEELVKLYKNNKINFKNVTIFTLDEYLGTSIFRKYLEDKLINHINIKRDNWYFLDGLTKNQALTCEKYEKQIKNKGGFDLCILGIGMNGHLAFNEPGSDFNSRTRLVNLTEETQKINTPCPSQALTIGLGTILDSKKILLLAGKEKNQILKKAIGEPVSKDIPASILQKHPNTLIYKVEDK